MPQILGLLHLKWKNLKQKISLKKHKTSLVQNKRWQETDICKHKYQQN